MSCYIKSCSIPLGRNKRMLALKAPERFANTDSEERAKSDRFACLVSITSYKHLLRLDVVYSEQGL